MRSLKEIYPNYQDRLNFVVVGHDLSESPEKLKAYRDQQGYPSRWEITVDTGRAIAAYGVLTQATKFVVDASGIIAARDGYGVKSADDWREVLDRVTQR